MAPSVESKSQLLVEGKNDSAAIRHLMMRHGVDWNSGEPRLPFVRQTDGVERLLGMVGTALKAATENLGLVLDMDADSVNRWEQVKGAFQALGVAVPNTPDLAGTIIPGTRHGQRVGIWLMPDNTSPGKLEHFLAKLVPADDPCWPHAETSATRARELGAAFAEKDFIKAHIHTWLAWQETPGLPFGTALTASVLRHDSPEALAFVAWFNRLFLD
jgi:hypothetical protein